MKKPVIVETDVIGKIHLEEKYDYNAKLTIGLAEGGDFYLVINFIDLKMEDLKTLGQLSRLTRRISIKSDIIDRGQYNITHIVVTKFTTSSNLSMTWECLSDDPELYSSLIIE
jgi:hypothetical protein